VLKTFDPKNIDCNPPAEMELRMEWAMEQIAEGDGLYREDK